MPSTSSEKLLVCELPSLHFEANSLDLADSFDDFLTEEVGLEFVAKFIEDEGKFVARKFFPLVAISVDEMRTLERRFTRKVAGEQQAKDAKSGNQ